MAKLNVKVFTAIFDLKDLKKNSDLISKDSDFRNSNLKTKLDMRQRQACN